METETVLRTGEVITSGHIEALRELAEAYETEIKRLRDALEQIAEGDIMRDVGIFNLAEVVHAYQRIARKAIQK